MSAKLFTGVLSSSFRPSQVLLLQADKGTFDFTLETSGGPTTVEWYLAFGQTPAECEFREVTETVPDVDAPGAIQMPKVLRTFAEADGAGLADGTHKISVSFSLKHELVRLYLRVSAGACRATVTAPFGVLAA